MFKIVEGTKAADFTFDTPFETGLKLSEKVKEAKHTYLVFLRYYGCTLCQLDIREYANNYKRFQDKDAQILVVLQSPASTINADMKKGDLPYDIICDPDQTLYGVYELAPAANMEAMMAGADPEVFAAKKVKMAEYGLSHGSYEGIEEQLPGMFLLDSDMNVMMAHRAANILDMPNMDEMIAKL